MLKFVDEVGSDGKGDVEEGVAFLQDGDGFESGYDIS